MKINEDYKKLQQKLNLFVGLKKAFQETKEAGKKGKKLQTLKDFMQDTNS